MIDVQYNCDKGKEPKQDTLRVLEEIYSQLIDLLIEKGIDSRDSEFLSKNDIHVFKGTNVTIISFSRSREIYLQTINEISLSEKIPDENKINQDTISYFDSIEWVEYPKRELNCVSPVSILIPNTYWIKYKEIGKNLAEMLLPIIEEENDKKKRIVRINPIFFGRDYIIESDLCFVLLEFSCPYTDIYENLIKPTIEEEGFRCLKSDDIFSTNSVIEDIWANINKSALIVAEISSNNPNVLYELGICHTVGKNVMMITQYPEEIPFNFRHMRCYPYKNDISGSVELKRNIKSVLQHIRAVSR